MALIKVLEYFEILLHRDVEAFHVDEASKKKVWDTIDKEFTDKETDNTKTLLKRQWLTNKSQKEGKKS